MDVWLSIITTLILTIFNGIFSMSEMAVVNANKMRLEHDASDGDKRAKRALALSSDSGSFLATIQVAITLVGFASSAFASTNLSDPLSGWLSGFGFAPLTAIAPTLAPVLITLIVSYLSIVIGELVPKRIALSNAEGVSKSVAGFLTVFKKIAKPLVWLTSASANAISTVFRIKSADERQTVTTDEIKYMVAEQDDIGDDEKKMISDVFDLSDSKAREVMIPRVDVTMIGDDSTVRQTLDVMMETGYSRLPVYHGDQDRIVGVAHVKDLVNDMLNGKLKESDTISGYLREADFVPDTKNVLPLLTEMRSKHNHMVIVIDEYGGTVGIITIEDIVEEITGEIADEFDPDNKYITQTGEREWVIDGRFPCDDAAELGWPITEDGSYETVAGWLLELADGVPESGSVFEQDGYTFTVKSVHGQRISFVKVVAPEQSEDDDVDVGSSEDIDDGDGEGAAS